MIRRPKPLASRYDVWTGEDVDGDQPPDPATPEYLDWLTRDDSEDAPAGRIGFAPVGGEPDVEPDHWYPLAGAGTLMIPSAITNPASGQPGSFESPLEEAVATIRYHSDDPLGPPPRSMASRRPKPPFKIEFSDGREIWVNNLVVSRDDG